MPGALAVLGAAALLTGCTSSSGGATTSTTPGSSTGTAPQSSAPTSAPTASAPSPPTTSTATATSSATPKCASADLSGTVDATKGSGAAGSIYYPVDLTNVSGGTCFLRGNPGVSFVTGPSGTQLGRSARWTTSPPPTTVTLQPGQTGHATLQVAEASNYDASQCKPATAHYLRIYPPNDTGSLVVPFTARACSARLPAALGSQLSVSVVQPGGG